MTKPTPSFETTAFYVTDTVNFLAEPQTITENHALMAIHVPKDSDNEVFSVHASLEIPRRPDFDPARMKRYGSRSLKVTVLGAAMTREDYEQIPDVIGINSAYRFVLGDETTVSPVMGELWYHFNTKRLLKYGATVYREGYHAGIQEDEDIEGFVFDELGIPKRSRGDNAHRYVAEIVEDESMINGISEIRSNSIVDFVEAAKDIARDTKKPVPQSFATVPHVTLESRGPLYVGPGDPYMTTSRLTIDDYRNHERSLTDVSIDTYEGFEPGPGAQEEYFFYKKYMRENGSPLGIGYDLSQVRSSAEGIRTPEDDADARRMLMPLIQSMTNLRRYANAAYGPVKL